MRAKNKNEKRPSDVKSNYSKLALGLFILLVFSLCTVSLLSFSVATKLTHPDRTIAKHHPSKKNLPTENIIFLSRKDKISLSGWIIKAKRDTNKWVILSHGYGGNRNIFGSKGPNFYKFLHDNGYNILTFDYRNSGVSDGKITTVGYHEENDLLGAIDYILTINADAEICLMGWSQGAAVSLLTASKHESVKLVVADSSFRNLQGFVNENLSQWSNLPNYPFTPAILFMIPIITGTNIADVSPIDAINNFNGPILLIHSINDTTIPAKNSKYIYEKYKEKKEITLILYDSDRHKDAYKQFPKQYKADILEFFNRYGF
ncbi:hypothetical protein CIB95_03630 [Lottiidibacillus patelloidae]|uniref:AB hydrolase-1 domain-containing protein n=1 Tax=Lottiidibacillus patelloidae TaxID=2670334 RepID=A0A263BY26_9BACI|nr:alpha/beta hydrolase [Lottiidibacillus patelloidae]OZM58671.1 hypothetical protein CIB95_03630 [Lottiidibacillus patelloidae]